MGGPAGIPRTIIERIANEIQKLVAQPETIEILKKMGFEPYYNGPEKTAELLKADIVKYARVIKAANIKAE